MRAASSYEKSVKTLFEKASIQINGQNDFDPKVHDQRFYFNIMKDGTLGLGESYMLGYWDCENIPEMMYRFSKAKLSVQMKGDYRFLLNKMRAKIFNEGDRENAAFGVRSHYDIGNDLFERMLDPRMVYTCAYWNGAKNLEEAQENKLELLCRKLNLKEGDKILDIGGGWGSFAKYAAEKYGAEVTVVTKSQEQIKLGEDICQGLPVEFQFKDYRDAKGSFDKVLSVGMFEHVCFKNHRTYMEVVHNCLKDDGLSVLHTMGRTKSMVRGNDLWITKYIFPNTQVPSVQQIGAAIDGIFVMEDWENLSTDYEKTLLAWFENFDQHWPELKDKYGDRFYRMWKYYLHICAGWY